VTAIATVRGVDVVFGAGPHSFRALDSVDVDLRAGELTLVTGPSGSGKTTLLSVLGLLRRPDAGQYVLAGTDVTRLGDEAASRFRRTHIGYVFQAFRLFRALDAQRNVMLALDLQGLPAREAKDRSLAALEKLGVLAQARLLPAQLSGGQKQRVAIARALINEPSVVLADEPTASLDESAAEEVATQLSNLAHQAGRAVAVVSHDARWNRVADRVVHIANGRVV